MAGVLIFFPSSHSAKTLSGRIRVINLVTDEPHWVTVAYFPIVNKLTESAADERAKLRRSAVLQPVLYMTLRSSINSSHSGVAVHNQDGQVLTAFPRLLLYISDQPEEMAGVCLKQGMCRHPCSHCTVELRDCGTERALNAEEGFVLRTLRNPSEFSGHRRYSRHSGSRLELETTHSITGFLPAIAGMAGLSYSPNLLFRTIGFDMLHVRCCVFASRCLSFVWSDVSWRPAQRGGTLL